MTKLSRLLAATSLLSITLLSGCYSDDSDVTTSGNHSADTKNYELRLGTQVCKKADPAYCNQAGAKSNPDGGLYLRRNDGSIIAAQSSTINAYGTIRFTLSDGSQQERLINTFFVTDSAADFSFIYRISFDYATRIIAINSVNLVLTAQLGSQTFAKTFYYSDETLWSEAYGVSSLLFDYGISLFSKSGWYGTQMRVYDISGNVVLDQQ